MPVNIKYANIQNIYCGQVVYISWHIYGAFFFFNTAIVQPNGLPWARWRKLGVVRRMIRLYGIPLSVVLYAEYIPFVVIEWWVLMQNKSAICIITLDTSMDTAALDRTN